MASIFIDRSAKRPGAHGIPTTEIVFMCHANHDGLTLRVFLPRVGRWLFATRNLGLEVKRGFFLFSTTAFNFVAVQLRAAHDDGRPDVQPSAHHLRAVHAAAG